MTRFLKKQFKVPRSGFKYRIRWYEQSEGEDIRLQLEDTETKIQLYPSSKEEADHVWFMFRQGISETHEPFVSSLVDLLVKKYPNIKSQGV